MSILSQIGPILFTGAEIGAGFSVTGPLLEKAVAVGCGRNQPIHWLPQAIIPKVFGASFFYAGIMFGLKGLPACIAPRPRAASPNLDGESLPKLLVNDGLVMGFGNYLHQHCGNQVLFHSEIFGNGTLADGLI